MRLDLFLKQTALIKRRTIAKELADKGRVLVNDKVAKPSTDVKDGDQVLLILGSRRVNVVAGIENRRGREIPLVKDLYQEKVNEAWVRFRKR